MKKLVTFVLTVCVLTWCLAANSWAYMLAGATSHFVSSEFPTITDPWNGDDGTFNWTGQLTMDDPDGMGIRKLAYTFLKFENVPLTAWMNSFTLSLFFNWYAWDDSWLNTKIWYNPNEDWTDGPVNYNNLENQNLHQFFDNNHSHPETR